MIESLTSDLHLLKKRTFDLQTQARTTNLQVEQCEQLNNSTHFMSLSMNNKFSIVRSKAVQNQREVAAAMEVAKEDLDAERREVQEMKTEILAAIQEAEELKEELRARKMELHSVEEEERRLRSLKEEKLKEIRRNMSMLIDMDVGECLTRGNRRSLEQKTEQRERTF